MEESLTVEEHGTLVLLRPNTDVMRALLRRLTGPDAMWWGGALVVEPRYVSPIVKAIAGLSGGRER